MDYRAPGLKQQWRQHMQDDPIVEAISRLADAYSYLRIALQQYEARIAELEDRLAAERQAHEATIAHANREHSS
jgi:hypothetical protein